MLAHFPFSEHENQSKSDRRANSQDLGPTWNGKYAFCWRSTRSLGYPLSSPIIQRSGLKPCGESKIDSSLCRWNIGELTVVPRGRKFPSIVIPPSSTTLGGPFGAVGVSLILSVIHAASTSHELRTGPRTISSSELNAARTSVDAAASQEGLCRR